MQTTMEHFNVIENLDKLPPLLQFIIVLAWFTVPPIISIWRIQVNSEANRKEAKAQADARIEVEKANLELKIRMEAVENSQIKVKSDADNAKAASENTARIIDGWFKSEERWQKNYDVNSERQREIHLAYIKSLDRHTIEISGFREALEIQSGTHSGVLESVNHMENEIKTAVQEIRTAAQDNRTDFTNALANNVKHQLTTEETLRNLYTAINGLRSDVTNIISQRENVRNQTLLGIEAKFQSIEANISALIAPRPVLLGDTIPIPDAIPQDDKPNVNSLDAAPIAAEETKP